MGTPTEGLTYQQIQSEFGWVTEFEGEGTDDSLMATILAETLGKAGSFATADEWAEEIHRNRRSILEKRDRFFPSVLHLVEKLDAGYRPSDVAHGNMPSSSSAMCIWPVALVNAGQPEAAARQAYELARLIHVNDADHCTDAAAALAAGIAGAFMPDSTIGSCLDQALKVIRPISGRVFSDALQRTIRLAGESSSYAEFRTRYQAAFSQPIFCDSLETVPAAFALALLADGDAGTAVEYAANFGRDSDTIASMSGALCGALTGEIPSAWFASLGPEAVESASLVATSLLKAAVDRLLTEKARLDLAATVLGVGL
jgi:ADP-ribosylglycohydrolase